MPAPPKSWFTPLHDNLRISSELQGVIVTGTKVTDGSPVAPVVYLSQVDFSLFGCSDD